MVPTLQELWKHLSNKVFIKYGDPHDELFASVIPIDMDGSFMDAISSDTEEYGGDPYDLLRDLATRRMDELPTKTFGFFAPGWMRAVPTDIDADDPEFESKMMSSTERTKMFAFVLVNDHENLDFGMWNMATNEVTFEMGEGGGGRLADYLKALSFGWSAVNDIESLGELAGPVQEAMHKIAALSDIMTKINKIREGR